MFQLRDFNTGTKFPLIKDVSVANAVLDDTQQGLNEVTLLLNIEYRGGFELSLDLPTVMNRTAFLSVQLQHLAGTVRLQFTKIPYTHWVFCFEQVIFLRFSNTGKG